MPTDETNKTNEGTPQTTGQSSQGNEGSTSNQPPKTYTVGTPEYNQHVSDIKAGWGRDWKALETERDTLKTNAGALTSERDSLKAQIKVIEDAGGEPAKLIQKLREVEARELTATEGMKEVTAFKRGKLIREVAGLYETGDAEALTKAADRFNVSSKDGLTALAEEKGWKLKEATKPPEPPAAPPIHVDSGGTNGGGVDEDKLNSTEKIKLGLERAKKKK